MTLFCYAPTLATAKRGVKHFLHKVLNEILAKGFNRIGLSVRVLDPGTGDRRVLWRQLAPDEPEAFQDSRLARRPRPHKRLMHHTARRRHQAAQVAHQVGGLDGGMVVTLTPRIATRL